jgi:serine/threonine protein kinase
LDNSQQPLKLNRNHVGGEWISLTLDHPNIASNTHLVVWDSFDQNEVQAQITNRYMLQEGRQLYVVATIGDYAEGSLDLECYFKLNPRRGKEEVQGMLYDIFQGVAAMNDMQIVHRDLKDVNVIRLPTGQMQIIDFGTAGFLNQGKSLHVLGGGGVLPFESHFEVGS